MPPKRKFYRATLVCTTSIDLMTHVFWWLVFLIRNKTVKKEPKPSVIPSQIKSKLIERLNNLQLILGTRAYY